MEDMIFAFIDLAALTALTPRLDPEKSLRRMPANQGDITSGDDGAVSLVRTRLEKISCAFYFILRG
jgi:hypothetical protein